MATTEDDKDVGVALQKVHEILAVKHKALDDRKISLDEQEAAFQKRVSLFEQNNPQSGKESDVLSLNVGGSTYISVLRRTLTQFEDSKLASMFGGRWDDSLVKDKDGNFFIDHDPETFLQLIRYLRKLDQKMGNKNVHVQVPAPHREFGGLLEYYNLTLAIYPQQWTVTGGSAPGVVRKPPSPDGHLILHSPAGRPSSFILDLDSQKKRKPAMYSRVKVVFKPGAYGTVGWASTYSKEHDE